MWKVTRSFWRRKRKKAKKKAPDSYNKNLSEEETYKAHQYHRDWDENLPEEEKQKKVEYMRVYYLAYKK